MIGGALKALGRRRPSVLVFRLKLWLYDRMGDLHNALWIWEDRRINRGD